MTWLRAARSAHRWRSFQGAGSVTETSSVSVPRKALAPGGEKFNSINVGVYHPLGARCLPTPNRGPEQISEQG